MKSNVKIIFENSTLLILEPLNFEACKKYSEDTEWCSKEESGYNQWAKHCLLIRVINKKTLEKIRLTWSYEFKNNWTWSAPIYPEYSANTLAPDVNLKSRVLLTPFDFDKFKYALISHIPEDTFYNRGIPYFKAKNKKINTNTKYLKRIHKLMNRKEIILKMSDYYEQRRNDWQDGVQKRRDLEASKSLEPSTLAIQPYYQQPLYANLA